MKMVLAPVEAKRSFSYLGGTWGHLGGIFDYLGPSWAHAGVNLGLLGPTWGQHGVNLEPYWANLGWLWGGLGYQK